jgi:hypothetical protein
MEDLSLHILDIVENSIRAGASKIKILIFEDIKANLLLLEICDNGKGMDEDMVKRVCDPFYTTKSVRRVGLGLPLLAQTARECGGDLKIDTGQGKGSTVTASFQHDHIDRKPMGDIEKTMTVLIVSHPDIDFILEHKKGNSSYMLDTGDLKRQLDDIPINNPEVIKFIKNDINNWLNMLDNVIE